MTPIFNCLLEYRGLDSDKSQSQKQSGRDRALCGSTGTIEDQTEGSVRRPNRYIYGEAMDRSGAPLMGDRFNVSLQVL